MVYGLSVTELGLTLSPVGDVVGDGDGEVGVGDGRLVLLGDGDGLALCVGFVPPPVPFVGLVVGEDHPVDGVMPGVADGVCDGDGLGCAEALADGEPPSTPESSDVFAGALATAAAPSPDGVPPPPPATANAVPTPPAATSAVRPVTASTRREPRWPSSTWMKSYRTERSAPPASRRTAWQKLTCVPSKRTTRGRGGSSGRSTYSLEPWLGTNSVVEVGGMRTGSSRDRLGWRAPGGTRTAGAGFLRTDDIRHLACL